ncbi:MAG: HNH endonuclease [Acidobacteriota bacterium]|nr:HNH endonuclease [Acidobacteriota bacterium]
MPDRDAQESVRQRARGLCEYCRDPLIGKRSEIDHIRPRSRGGPDVLANFALACSTCNGNKGNAEEAVDAVTGATVRLFHPRQDVWDAHFTVIDGAVTGKTAIGRATAALLFRVTAADFGRDVHWSWLTSLDDEVAYTHLNRVRVLRLANRFDHLDRVLAQPPVMRTSSSRKLSAFLHHLVRAEMLMMRGRGVDLDCAELLVRRALRRFGTHLDRRNQMFATLGGILARKGTLLMLGGESHRARRLWQESMALRELSGPWAKSSAFVHSIRVRGNLARFGGDAGMIDAPMLHVAGQHAANGDYRPLVGLADIALASASTPPLDRLLDMVTRTLLRSTYGSDRDHAATVVLRRRWWGLLVAAGERPDLDLLQRDVEQWHSIEMFNEHRELEWTLRMPWVARREEATTLITAALSTRVRRRVGSRQRSRAARD